MNPVAIRVAALSERAALEALQRRASLIAPEYREALLAHPDAISVPDDQLAQGYVFVAEAAGAIVGFAAVLPREDGEVELDALFVEPHSWRGGIGRLLVCEAAVRTSAAGGRYLHVIANPTALAFYDACGFEQTGAQTTRFGPAVTMRLAVPQRG